MLLPTALIVLCTGCFGTEDVQFCNGRPGFCQASMRLSTGNSLLQLVQDSRLKAKAPDDDFDFDDDTGSPTPVEPISYFNLSRKIGHQVGNMTEELEAVKSSVDTLSQNTSSSLP